MLYMDNARQYGALQSTVWVVKVVFDVMAHFAGVCVQDNMRTKTQYSTNKLACTYTFQGKCPITDYS